MAGEGEGEGKEAAIISLEVVKDKNLKQLKEITFAILPDTYNEKYYALSAASCDFTNLAYYNDICVGHIACLLKKKEGDGDASVNQVYIMSLGVLPPYRGLGIGKRLLKHVVDLSLKQNIPQIFLHVETNNEVAINLYNKLGFEITETLKTEKYDVFVLTKFLTTPISSQEITLVQS